MAYGSFIEILHPRRNIRYNGSGRLPAEVVWNFYGLQLMALLTTPYSLLFCALKPITYNLPTNMRIGIDARLYGPRTGGGGLGRYVEQLVSHLEKLDQHNEYVVFLRDENWNEFRPTGQNFKKVRAPWRWYTLTEQIHLPRLIKKEKLDLIHYPHFNIPIFSKTPYVVTIHDLNLLLYAKTGITNLDPIRFWSKYLGFCFVLKQGLKCAKKIITVSNATRNDIVKYFPFTKDKILTIPLGYTKTDHVLETGPLITNFQLPTSPYTLAVGNAYPHKNLNGLITSFHEVLKSFPNIKLVLVGPKDRFRYKILDQVYKLGITDNVIFTGFVDDAALIEFYKNASAYIMPSYLEGFGFPGIEAQFHNTPVLASDIPALRETFADAAIYFDPKNPYAIAHSICKILTDKNLAQTLKNNGQNNINRFNWDQTTIKTLEVYKSSRKQS